MTEKELTAERVLQLNFERHAKDAVQSITEAMGHLRLAAKYGVRTGSLASISVSQWVNKLAAVADTCNREVTEAFVAEPYVPDDDDCNGSGYPE